MCVTIVCDWWSTKTTSYEQLLYPNWSNFIITFPYTNNLGNGFLVRAHLLPSSVVTTRTVHRDRSIHIEREHDQEITR